MLICGRGGSIASGIRGDEGVARLLALDQRPGEAALELAQHRHRLGRRRQGVGQHIDGQPWEIGGLAVRRLAGERGDVTLGAAGMCG